MGDESNASNATADGQQSGGLDVRLIGLCVVLWIVAAGILYENWPDTKRDYYWGNIMQGLEGQPPRLDAESISALAAMGDAIIPSCSYELTHHWNAQFRCAVLKVLEDIKTENARATLEWASTHDLNARVRANALLSLRARARSNPSEQAALVRLADEVAFGKTNGDPDINVRAAAGLILGESGDARDPVKALLVYDLRFPSPFFRKEAAAAIAHVASNAPAFNPDASGKDLVAGIIANEEWLEKQGIALVASPVTMPVTSSARDGK